MYTNPVAQETVALRALQVLTWGPALQAEGQALPRGPTWWPEKPQTPAPQPPEAIDGHSAHAANS